MISFLTLLLKRDFLLRGVFHFFFPSSRTHTRARDSRPLSFYPYDLYAESYVLSREVDRKSSKGSRKRNDDAYNHIPRCSTKEMNRALSSIFSVFFHPRGQNVLSSFLSSFGFLSYPREDSESGRVLDRGGSKRPEERGTRGGFIERCARANNTRNCFGAATRRFSLSWALFSRSNTLRYGCREKPSFSVK